MGDIAVEAEAVAAERVSASCMLRLAANERMKQGDVVGAAALYREALALPAEETGEERHLLLGNLSSACLTLGDAEAALRAAEEAALACPSYSKAYFRASKALLALKRPQEAADSLRRCIHAARAAGIAVGPSKDLEAALEEANRQQLQRRQLQPCEGRCWHSRSNAVAIAAAAAAAAASAVAAVPAVPVPADADADADADEIGSGDEDCLTGKAGNSLALESQLPIHGSDAASVPAAVASTTSALDLSPEILPLIAQYCEGPELAKLGQAAFRFWDTVATEEAFLKLAAKLCPHQLRRLVRSDWCKLGIGAGWILASRMRSTSFRGDRFLGCGKLLFCNPEGSKVTICDPCAGGGVRQDATFPGGCIPCSLCWGPHSEYVAYSSPHLSGTASLVVCPLLRMQQQQGTLPAEIQVRRPIVIPVKAGGSYYLSPSKCGSFLAFLAPSSSQQVLFLADISQATAADPEKAPPVAIRKLTAAAPLYFDWSPINTDLLVSSFNHRQLCFRGWTAERTTRNSHQGLWQPSFEVFGEALMQRSLRGRISYRAPQWLPPPLPSLPAGTPPPSSAVPPPRRPPPHHLAGFPSPSSRSNSRGKWLLPRDSDMHQGHVSLVLEEPFSWRRANEDGRGAAAAPLPAPLVVVETLPSEVTFAASGSGKWVAWSGGHDVIGHAGVFVRQISPHLGQPAPIILKTAVGLVWAGDRLAILLMWNGELVWIVWDPPAEASERGAEEMDDMAEEEESCIIGRLTIASRGFRPSNHFALRVLPFFEQFSRSHCFWSPQQDALVYCTVGDKVWVQPFPTKGQEWQGSRDAHALSSFLNYDIHVFTAPDPWQVAHEGSLVFWSPC